jgi:hypothetical protein
MSKLILVIQVLVTQPHMARKKSATTSNDEESLTVSGSSHKIACVWLAEDEKAFLQYIFEHKSEAGDGMNFKITFWRLAAEHMKSWTSEGGEKNAEACKNKWVKVRLHEL